MPKFIRKLLETIPPEEIPKWSQRTEERFWNDKKTAPKLYDDVLRFPDKDVCDDGFIELVRKTLVAFGANRGSRGKVLVELPDFTNELKKIVVPIQLLAKHKLETLECDELVKTIGRLFDELQIVRSCQKAKLGAFSKTMHFLLPDLFVPMNGEHTLRFYIGHTPTKYTRDDHKDWFLQAFEDCRRYAHEHHEVLKKQVDAGTRWNRSIPKVIDSIIIGYMLKPD